MRLLIGNNGVDRVSRDVRNVVYVTLDNDGKVLPNGTKRRGGVDFKPAQDKVLEGDHAGFPPVMVFRKDGLSASQHQQQFLCVCEWNSALGGVPFKCLVVAVLRIQSRELCFLPDQCFDVLTSLRHLALVLSWTSRARSRWNGHNNDFMVTFGKGLSRLWLRGAVDVLGPCLGVSHVNIIELPPVHAIMLKSDTWLIFELFWKKLW